MSETESAAVTRRINRRRKRARTTQEQWEWQGKLCFYCDVETWLNPGIDTSVVAIPLDRLKTMATREHLIRLADDGPDTRENVVVACHECNSTRGETPWEDYLDEKEAASRSNCPNPESGYGLYFFPTKPTPEFRVEDTYFCGGARKRIKL